MKLTKHQNAVINFLQKGGIIMTSCDFKGAEIGNRTIQFHINNGVLRNLVSKKLVFQNIWERHNFTLTQLGWEVKTKDVDVTTIFKCQIFK